MINKIIHFSVHNKLITGVLLGIFMLWGIYSFTQLSIDALPDVTNNQVQVVTNSPNLATQEVEQFITYPLETEFKSLQGLVELRSTSRSGLSVITIVFKEYACKHYKAIGSRKIKNCHGANTQRIWLTRINATYNGVRGNIPVCNCSKKGI